MTRGYVAYDSDNRPVGMGPTRASAIAEARHNGCASGRLRQATPERIAEASRAMPERPRPAQEPGTSRQQQHSPAPRAEYFQAVCRGDFRRARELLATLDEARPCRT